MEIYGIFIDTRRGLSIAALARKIKIENILQFVL